MQMILKIIGKAAEEVDWLCYLTLFTAYEPQWFVNLAMNQPESAWSWLLYKPTGERIGIGPMGCNMLLVGVGAACYLIGGLVFARRDLPAPL